MDEHPSGAARDQGEQQGEIAGHGHQHATAPCACRPILTAPRECEGGAWYEVAGMVNRYPYVHVLVAPDDVELASYELWELGASGVEERDGSTMNAPDANIGVTLVASFEDAQSAQAAADALVERWSAQVR